MVEALLAYAHITAILALVVFLTSEAALCRSQWLNAAVVHRLVKVDILYLSAAVLVLLTGFARTWWGVKGFAWYWHQDLLWLKVGGYGLIALLSSRPTMAFLRWRRDLESSGTLPDAADIQRVRRMVLIEAHLLMLIPLAAALLARGAGHRLF